MRIDTHVAYWFSALPAVKVHAAAAGDLVGANSVEPNGFQDPVSPVDPASPVGPAAVDPAPVDPVDPTVDPVAPANPGDPGDPSKPVEPQFATARGMLEKLASGGFNPVAALRHQMKHAETLREAGIVVPEPSEAPKGKAYAKFLEQYRAMQQGVSEPAAKPDPLPAVDAAA